MKKFERGVLFLLIGQIVWGISPVLVGRFLGDAPASLVLAIRHTIAGILFLAILLSSGAAGEITTMRWSLMRRLLLWSALTSGLAELLWLRSIQDAGVIIATLLVRLEIPFAVVFATWYLRERMTKPLVIATVLRMGGAVLLTINGEYDASHPALLAGALEGFVAALLWTWAGVYAKKMLTEGNSAILLSSVRTWVGAVVNGMIVLVGMGSISVAVGKLSINQWLVICYLAVFASVIGLLLYYKGMEYTSASVAAVLLSSSLVIATLGGIVIGERLSSMQWAGAAMIVGALVVTSYKHRIPSVVDD